MKQKRRTPRTRRLPLEARQPARRAALDLSGPRRAEEGAAVFTATEAKTGFGRLLEMAIQGHTVVISKHDAPKAVLISFEAFNALSQARGRALDALTDEFDALLSRMQTPAARAAMKSAFDASPNQLGRAAAAAARKRD